MGRRPFRALAATIVQIQCFQTYYVASFDPRIPFGSFDDDTRKVPSVDPRKRWEPKVVIAASGMSFGHRHLAVDNTYGPFQSCYAIQHQLSSAFAQAAPTTGFRPIATTFECQQFFRIADILLTWIKISLSDLSPGISPAFSREYFCRGPCNCNMSCWGFGRC